MRVPKLCLHRGRQLGYVTLDGVEEYFSGKWDNGDKTRPPRAVKDQYEKRIREWLASKGKPVASAIPADDLTLAELWLQYFQHCQQKYQKHGQPTSEQGLMVAAISPAVELYGSRPVSAFGRSELRALRVRFVERGWTRESVNKAVRRIVRMFAWGVDQDLVPDAAYFALKALKPLQRNEGGREVGDVRPVAWQDVEATLPYLRPALQDMIRVHWLLGCRSQDICRMRPCDIDRSGELWLYIPTHAETGAPTWKTEHRGGEPVQYWIGPAAQKILLPWLEKTEATEYLWLSRYGRVYTPVVYGTVVRKVCLERELTHWFPLQIRHSRLTEIRRAFGAEAAQLVARHQKLATTEIYAERDDEIARKVMQKMG